MLRKCFLTFLLAYLLKLGKTTERQTNSPRIIIVGAGASGISAALQLLDNGFNNIKILEAENRIGGRIYSVNFGDGVIDLGAEFVLENSTVYNLVSNLSLLTNGIFQSEVYHSKAGRLSENFLKKLFQNLAIFHHQKKPEGGSWKQYIVDQLNSTVFNHFENESEKLLAKENINFIEKSFILISGTGSLDNISGEGSDEYIPDFRFVWKKGYKSFLDNFVNIYQKSKLDYKFDDIITLKTEVENIQWDDQNSEVKLTCKNGSIYTADHVIVTLPLGVLKKHNKNLFLPSLPSKKQKTIETLGIGILLKIAYYFPEKWWSDSNFMFAWSEDDLISVDFKEGPSKNGQSWVTNFTGFSLVPNNPNVLFALYIGDLIPEVELCSDDVLLNGAYYVLQKFLGKTYKNITKPTKLAFNNWITHPHFYGAVSYQTVESVKNKVSWDDLAEPVAFNGKPRLLFSGEATSRCCYGSVNGAVLSGFREANRIIDVYK